jgi:hypothetical protein
VQHLVVVFPRREPHAPHLLGAADRLAEAGQRHASTSGGIAALSPRRRPSLRPDPAGCSAARSRRPRRARHRRSRPAPCTRISLAHRAPTSCQRSRRGRARASPRDRPASWPALRQPLLDALAASLHPGSRRPSAESSVGVPWMPRRCASAMLRSIGCAHGRFGGPCRLHQLGPGARAIGCAPDRHRLVPGLGCRLSSG